MKAAKGDDHDDEMRRVTEFYHDDFNKLKLQTQLESLRQLADTEGVHVASFRDIVTLFSGSDSAKTYLSEVNTILHLILVSPATNAVSGRS